MYKLIAGTLATIGLLCSIQASAAVTLTQWGATARTDSADCTGFVCDILNLALETGEEAGGSQQTTATIGSATDGSDVNLQGRGTAGASVEIPASGLNLPVLRARAESNSIDGWVGGSALGIQGYQFTGANPTLVSLDVNLTGSVVNPSGSSVTGLEANVWILKPTVPFTFPAEPVSVVDLVAQIIVDSILAMEFEPFIASLSWDAVTTGTGAIDRSTLTTDPADQLNFTLDNGDEFYLLAGLSAGAVGAGASALSWSTLTMEFDTNELQAASAVPLPAAVWLLGSGLIGLIAVGGRKRKGPANR